MFLAHCSQGCYNGICVSPNKCDCVKGWTSLNCTEGMIEIHNKLIMWKNLN